MELSPLILNDLPLRVFFDREHLSVEFGVRRLVKHYFDVGSTMLEGNYYQWTRAELVYALSVMDALPNYMQANRLVIAAAQIAELEEDIVDLEQSLEAMAVDHAAAAKEIAKIQDRDRSRIAAHRDTIAQLRSIVEPA